MRELLHRIDSRELTEWQCYFALEPWGEERADLRAGIVSSTIANVNRMKTSDKVWNATEFMPYYEDAAPTKKNSPETEALYFQLLLEISTARERKYGSAS